MFLEHGYEATTLDDLVDAVEVSKRTFFRNHPSKEAVALAAETELWDAYVAALGDRGVHGLVLDALRDALTATPVGDGRRVAAALPRHAGPDRPHPGVA